MEGSGRSVSVAQNTLFSGERARLLPETTGGELYPYQIPLTANAYTSFFNITLFSPSTPNFTISSVSTSTTGSTSSNIVNSYVQAMVTPTAGTDYVVAFNVPFLPIAVTEYTCAYYPKATKLSPQIITSVSPELTGSQVIVRAPGKGTDFNSWTVQIIFRLWSLNELLPYSPIMAFQRAYLQMDSLVNLSALETRNPTHASVKGSVTTVVASLSGTPTVANVTCTWRVRVPTVTRALVQGDVGGDIQTYPPTPGAPFIPGPPSTTTRAIYVQNGDIFVRFTPTSTSSHQISLVLNISA